MTEPASAPRVAPADRAALAEQAIRARSLRRLWALPGTRLGVVAWPPSFGQRLFLRWHYWWQAHLLDALVDAQMRAPDDERRATITRFIRGHRLRNGGRWGNNYYDDIAWWALALQRADELAGVPSGAAVSGITSTIVGAWSDLAGGGIPWRRGDVFRNTPANGPAAILLARTGYQDRALATADWIDQRLRIVGTDLIADGLVPGEADGEAAVDETVYTYCQGVVLGAELELAVRAGRDHGRIHRLVTAVGTHLAPGGVLTGHGGGNGGLFTGILARYLAQIAVRLPDADRQDARTRSAAAELVLRSADAAWRGARHGRDGPIFGPDWADPARQPGRGGTGAVSGNAMVAASREPERDLSVQLSGWMLMEAAALIGTGPARTAGSELPTGSERTAKSELAAGPGLRAGSRDAGPTDRFGRQTDH
ncbi:glycoside hydrolase family 76 protein [Nakamurella lactea]|uniref:glycoside hydrolase family 76 protein n=1 Tax=Nakamurella lactea TaxID=459515 RepID=UPI00041EDC14|nr:glycoside hydrolase family 76 protein [Nakamurella lactea]